MATPIQKYQHFVTSQYTTAPINFTSDTIKVMLTASTYAYNLATDTTKANVTNEVTGGGYTARGATITGVSANNVAGTLTISGNSVTWGINAGGFSNARYAIIYKDTGVDSTSTLIGLIDLGTNQSNVNGSLIINWNSTPSAGAVFSVV